jgi:two-component system, OmpR family, sensor histidine kinase PrrB
MRRPLSIRARVTLAATAAVAFVLVGGGILTVATFAQRERSSLDRELERRAHGPAGRALEILLPARGHPPRAPGDDLMAPGLPREAIDASPPGLLAESGTFVRLIRDKRVVEAVGDVPAGEFPLPRKLGFATVETDGGKWRTVTVGTPLERPFGPPVESTARLAQFAVDLEPLEDRIGSMRTRVAVISAAGIVLAAVLSSLLSGLALAPLSRLRQSVTGVTSTTHLSRRLPDSGSAAEVKELERSVNAMLTRLERSSKETERALEATRRFAADVGHELRTPLTSIRANIDALRRNPAMPNAETNEILEELASEQTELVSLLDSLQALARGDAAEALPRESFDLAETVDLAVEAARRRHPGTPIELAVPDDRQELVGWPDGLRLLVENLIENAVRHGGTRVSVELGRETGELVLSVDDDGPGVPSNERDRIFERFTRGSETTAPGSGLGLALVAQQASLHGGRVDVAGSRLGGASFSVRLPLDGGRQRSTGG